MNNSQIYLTYGVIFQICCSYQNSESYDQSDEISDSLNLSVTICEPLCKARESCYFSLNTCLLKKETAIIGSLMQKMCYQNFMISKNTTIIELHFEKCIFKKKKIN